MSLYHSHSERLQLLKDGTDSDFVIHCCGQSFRVHKKVLVEEPWFNALISNGFKESQEGEATIEDASALAMASILLYIYIEEPICELFPVY